MFSQARCTAILWEAADEIGVTSAEIASVEVGAEITKPRSVVSLSGFAPFQIDVLLKDGSRHQITIICAGIPGPPCKDDPELYLSTPTNPGGYFDRTADATPLPSLEPGLVQRAQGIAVASVDVPVGHAGHFEVSLGNGSLPNGRLSRAEVQLTDPWPPGIHFRSNEIRLVVRSLEGMRPEIRNAYDHGWQPGLERVEALLVFDVVEADSGASFEVRNVVVE